MPQTYQKSFLAILSLIFLSPLFFVPGGAIYLGNAKSAFLLLGMVLLVLTFSFEFWKSGALKFPKHYLVLITALLPLVYALSALLSTPSSLSLFGYGFEIGTFGFMLQGSLFLLLVSVLFGDTSRSLQGLTAFFISFSIIAILVAVKIGVGGDFLALGNFFGKMGNPVGNWTDLAIAFGLLSLFCSLAIGMLPMKLAVKAALYGVFVLSTALLAILNFQAALILTLVGAVAMILYFLKVENHFLHAPKGKGRFLSRPIFLPIVLIVITLLFIINPAVGVSGKSLNLVISQKLGLENVEVRPSFSATFEVSKAVLSQAGLLGSGPNTFSHDWLIYKPINVNSTPFWPLAFPFGVGFIPTQVASTGILGSLLWLAFFVALGILAIKFLSRIPESRAARFVSFSSLVSTLFLWAGGFIYAPSATMLFMAFFFTGLFVASLAQASIIPSYSLNWRTTPQSRTVYFLSITIVCLGALALGYLGLNKTAAAYHWKKANDLANSSGSVQSVEDELVKATEASAADIHYIALSKVNFLQAQAAANATGTPQENLTAFDEALSQSIDYAKRAVAKNPAGYANWVMLGSVYGALVAEPLKVEGAYENARFAYEEALKRNPGNPETYLLLAKLELYKEDPEAARSYLRNAIALKEDYADAYMMLAQLEVMQGNAPAAIASAERLTALIPNNPGLYFELGVLKYSNKDYASAEGDLRRALALSPENGNAKYYLGLTLAALDKEEEARAHFEELLAANPDNEELKKSLKDLND
jgi:cytochrome c-type biogenesis protein CcmH/NrfG